MSNHVKRQDAAQARVTRWDSGDMLAEPELTPQGYLLCEARVAKPGVLVYRKADGTTSRELLLPEELHKAGSLMTLARSPVTLEHPEEDVTPDNVGRYGVGDVDGEVSISSPGGYAKVRMAVRRSDALQAISNGKRDVSPGYDCRLEQTPGTHPIYGEYDAIQRDRIYNHVAICDRARGGADIHLRADSAYQVIDPSPPKKENDRMPLSKEEMEQIGELMSKTLKSRQDADDKKYMTKEDMESFGASLKKDMLESMKDMMGGEKKKKKEDEEGDPKGEDAKKTDAADPQKLAMEIVKLRDQAKAHGVEIKEGMGLAELRKAIVTKTVTSARQDADDSYYITMMDAVPKPADELPILDPWKAEPPTGGQQRQDSQKSARELAFEQMRKAAQ